jgi:hypothetical protein
MGEDLGVTDGVECFLACCSIMRTPQGLPIYGDHSLDCLAHTLDLLHKTGFKLSRIEQGKHRAKRIVRGNTIGQREQFREKSLFCLPEFLDLHPSFCSANDSTDGQNDDISSAMQLASFHARIVHLRKKAC